MEAIKEASVRPADSAVAETFKTAVAKQQAAERLVVRKREQEATEAAHRQEEEAVISGSQVELQALLATDPGMSLLTAVEYVTPDPAHRIALYSRHRDENETVGAARDLALLERRAMAEGFQVQETG